MGPSWRILCQNQVQAHCARQKSTTKNGCPSKSAGENRIPGIRFNGDCHTIIITGSTKGLDPRARSQLLVTYSDCDCGGGRRIPGCIKSFAIKCMITICHQRSVAGKAKGNARGGPQRSGLTITIKLHAIRGSSCRCQERYGVAYSSAVGRRGQVNTERDGVRHCDSYCRRTGCSEAIAHC